ncbi:MAG: Ig-like domain-containing protein [Clostridiales bacterium]|nr:Ig-like domain-containing protein [Clostridiales bacterium]
MGKRAIILSVLLAVGISVFGVPVRAEEKEFVLEQVQLLDENLQFITEIVEEALMQEQVDLQQQVFQKFLVASDLYDSLEENQKEQLDETIVEGLKIIRNRIGETIHTSEGVTAGSKDWFVKTNVSDGEEQESVLAALQKKYKGCAPVLQYYKKISYTDIRTGEDYRQKTMISLSFPVPEGYDERNHPKILTWSDGTLMELFPERKENVFYIEKARTLSNVIVAEVPIALTGLQLDSNAVVNAGQKLSLKVKTIPETVTEDYELVFKSSNTNVAKVSAEGVITGVKSGTATVTVSVKGSDIEASCQVTVVQGAHALNISVSKLLKNIRSYMMSIDQNPSIGSEWFVLGLVRSGMELDDSYFQTYYNHFANYLEENKGILTNSVKYTEYSKAAIVMTSIGKDARKIAGYNLLKPLADMDMVTAQGTNGPIWALIALNCYPDYTIPKVSSVSNQTTKEKLITYILEQEMLDGGWKMTGNFPDPDLTGMAIQALAPFYQKEGYEEVTAAIDRALEVLGEMQNTTGGYSTMGVETSESCSQVITALCALGIDPEKDERFVKGGNWTVENLLSYYVDGKGFMHVKADEGNNGGGAAGEVNGMATEQAYYALTAYQRFKNGQTSLYDMSDLELSQGQKGDGTGTGVTEPTPTPPSNTASPGGSGTSVSSGGGTNSPTSTGKKVVSTANPSQTSSSGKTVSSSKKNSGKTAKKDNQKDGWDFEAEEYQESGDGWDFDAEEVQETEAGEDAGNQISKGKTGKTIPPAAAGVFGGVAGAGLLEGSKILYRKRKGRKHL